MSRFEQLFEQFKDKVDFKIVYIRDTHPTLGFRAPTNDRRGIAPENEPKTLADREAWACSDREKMICTIPIIMDTMDDKTLLAYDAFPQRVYLIDKTGRVAYRSSGLVGFILEEATDALRKSLEGTNMSALKSWFAAVLVCTAAPMLHAQDRIPTDQFGSLRALIRPQEGESRWREIDWLTSLHEAREKAAAEGKPILLWSGGGAPPLGGC